VWLGLEYHRVWAAMLLYVADCRSLARHRLRAKFEDDAMISLGRVRVVLSNACALKWDRRFFVVRQAWRIAP